MEVLLIGWAPCGKRGSLEKLVFGDFMMARVTVNLFNSAQVQHNPAIIGGAADVASSCGSHFPDLQGHFLPPSRGQGLNDASYLTKKYLVQKVLQGSVKLVMSKLFVFLF